MKGKGQKAEGKMNDSSKTDWARIDAMTDEEIDTSDIPPLDEFFLRQHNYECRKNLLRKFL